MTNLKINRPEWIASKQPLIYEIIDQDLQLVSRGVLAGQQAIAAISDEKITSQRLLWAKLYAPDGRQLVTSFQVNENSDLMDIAFQQKRSDFLIGKPKIAKESMRSIPLSREACFGGNCTIDFNIASHAYQPLERKIPSMLRTRLWSFDTERDSWQPYAESRQPKPNTDELKTGVQYDVPVDRACILQYGHELLGVQHTMLPPGPILIKAYFSSQVGGSSQRLVLDIDLRESTAESLFPLLQTGDSERAAVLAKTVLVDSLVFGNDHDPMAALIGCYYWVRTRELQRLDQWVGQLIEHKYGLADTWIVHGWQHLFENRRDLALNCFIRAVALGLPILTEGLTMLVQGIRILGIADEPKIQRLVKYQQVISSTQPYLTFAGLDPNTPQRDSQLNDYALIEAASSFDLYFEN